MSKTPRTEPDIAPATEAPVEQPPVAQPPAYTMERQGEKNEPYTRRLPQVRGGVCEYCGTLDPNVPPENQYKLCPHFRGLTLRCSYCDETKDPEEVVSNSILNVAEHPEKRGTFIAWCGSYECSRAHEKRFRRDT